MLAQLYSQPGFSLVDYDRILLELSVTVIGWLLKTFQSGKAADRWKRLISISLEPALYFRVR